MSSSYSDPSQFSGPSQFPPPAKSGPGWGCFFIGCLGTLVVCIVLCAGSVWYISNNADRWIAGWAGEFIAAMVNESEIPEQEKQEVIAQVERVVNAYKDRQINQKDLERIMEQLQESPIFGLIMSYGLDQRYVEPSGLSDEEKQAARRTISRAMRGVLEKKIKQEEFNAALPDSFEDAEEMESEAAESTDPTEEQPAAEQAAEPTTVEAKPEIATPPVEGDAASGGELTDQQVRDFIAKLKKLADEAGIPDEDFQIDIGDEVKRAVDEALQRGGGQP